MTTYAQAARELLRSTLLDAARGQLDERPWQQVTMAQVAAAAGVSRQTLYNEFGSREALAQALVLREEDRFLAAVEAAVASTGHDDVAAALAAAFDVFLIAAREDPLVSAVLSVSGNEELLALLLTQGGPVLERAVDRLVAVVTSGWPGVSPHAAAVLAEILVRLAISLAAQPAGPAGLDAATVAEVLRPYAERLLG